MNYLEFFCPANLSLFSSLFVHSFTQPVNCLYQSRLMDIYFALWVVKLYHFSCLDAEIIPSLLFGAFYLASVSLTTSISECVCVCVCVCVEYFVHFWCYLMSVLYIHCLTLRMSNFFSKDT